MVCIARLSSLSIWIAESQMMKETEDVAHDSGFLNVKTNAHIVEESTLEISWEDIEDANKVILNK